jgi:hypothetical protein
MPNVASCNIRMVQGSFVRAASCCTMPLFCACGVRPRRDLSCSTPSCPAFRRSRLGANLTKQKVRLHSKHTPEAAAAVYKLSGDYRAKTREAREARAKADAEAADMKDIAVDEGADEAAENIDALLRGPPTEELLVELFGQSAYFTILALAYKWPPRTHPSPATTFTLAHRN